MRLHGLVKDDDISQHSKVALEGLWRGPLGGLQCTEDLACRRWWAGGCWYKKVTMFPKNWLEFPT